MGSRSTIGKIRDYSHGLFSFLESQAKEQPSMKSVHVFILIFVLALTVAAISQPAVAQDGGATFKAKCAGCHGAEGQGKVGPALKGTSLSADQISDLLTKGDDAKKPPHKKPMNGLSADDAKAVAAFVKGLK
jgi:mono/diheme cytochrome c family protein